MFRPEVLTLGWGKDFELAKISLGMGLLVTTNPDF